MVRWPCCLALIAASGCGRSALDGGEDGDGTGERDAGVEDVGVEDAGVEDAGVEDAGVDPSPCAYLQEAPVLAMGLDGVDSVLDEVVVDPDGGCFVSTSGCASRYATDGDLIWAASADVYCGRMAYDTARNELLVAAAVGVDGVSKSQIRAYDENGALAWNVNAGPDINQNSVTHAMTRGGDGSAVAVGMALDGGGALTWLGAYEPDSGTERWLTSLADVTASVNRRIAVDAAGSIYVMHTARRAAQVVKLDATGQVTWTYDRGSEDQDLSTQGIDMAVEPDGTVVLLGVVLGGGVQESFVDRISPEGERLWSLDTFASSWLEAPRSIAVGPCSEIVLTGSSDETHPFWLGRLEADGTPNWALSEAEGTPLDADVRPDGSFSVVGYVSDDGTGWLRRYDPD